MGRLTERVLDLALGACRRWWDDGHLIPDDEVWYVGDAIPNGTSAAIALLEHTWAIPLRDKIAAAGGIALADAWVHPADLIAVGALAGALADASETSVEA